METKAKKSARKSATKKSNVTTITKSKKNLTKLSKNQKAAVARHRINPQLKIVKVVDSNPRRKGTWGHKSFEKIRNGMTVEQFVEKGGRLADLRWDIQKGNVKLKNNNAA